MLTVSKEIMVYKIFNLGSTRQINLQGGKMLMQMFKFIAITFLVGVEYKTLRSLFRIKYVRIQAKYSLPVAFRGYSI